MFKLSKISFLLASSILLSAAVPAKLPIANIQKFPSQEMEDSTGKNFLCVNIGTLSKPVWQSGEKKKKQFLTDQARISALKSLKKSLKKEGKKLKKKDETLLKILSNRSTECKKYGPIPPIVASEGQYSGEGIEPLDVALNVNGGSPEKPYSCEILSEEGQGKIEVFDKCKVLVTPKDHLSTKIKLSFRASQEGDSRKSNIANAYITFNQSGDYKGDYYALKPYRNKLTEAEALHIIRWEALGRNRDAYMAMAQSEDGTNLLVNELTNPKSSANCEAVEAEALALASKEFSSFSRNTSMPVDRNGDGLKDLDINGREIKVNIVYKDESDKKDYWTVGAAQTYMLYMQQSGCQPMREKLAMLFHNHFPVNLNNFSGPASGKDFYIPRYINLVRGSYNKDYSKVYPSLDKVFSKLHGDPAMLVYLDNRLNKWYQVTNENYAREFMELFLLSPSDIVTKQSNYTEKDIYELSYSLTGYSEYTVPETRNTGTYCCAPVDPSKGCWAETRCTDFTRVDTRFVESDWDDVLRPRAEFLFKETPYGKFDVFKANTYEEGHDNVTPYIINEHPGASRYLSARLIANFASLDFTNEVLDEVASLLKSEGFNVGKVLTKIMSSSAYFSKEARYDCVAGPTETLLSFINLFNLPVSHATSRDNRPVNLYEILRGALNESGESLFQTATIFGWKACGKITGGHIHNGETWLGSQQVLGRLRGFTNYLNNIDWVAPSLGFNWTSLLPGERTPDAIINHFSKTIGIELKPAERDLMVSYLISISTANKTELNGNVVPDDTKIKIINPSTLSAAEFSNYWSLKGPGLLELFYGLKLNHLK